MNVAALLKQPIGATVDYRLHEERIDPRGENAGLLDAGAISIEADLLATHTNPGALLAGGATALVVMQCRRCLKPIESLVHADFAEQYYATIEVASGDPLAQAPRDAKTIGSDFRIDLTPLLHEELLLATPLAPLCRADCKGLCEACGDDQNIRPHEHAATDDERWANLRALRDFHAERE